MKKKMALLSSALIFASVAQVANAAEGTINIDGGVSDTTCKVSVNNNTTAADGTNIAKVSLPIVRPSALKNDKDTAGRTFINFALTDCGSTATLASTASVRFLASNDINSAGRLTNTLTDADRLENVEIELLNSDLSSINLTDVEPQHKTVVAIEDSKAYIRHFVQYYKVGNDPVAPGRLTASLEYDIDYQ